MVCYIFEWFGIFLTLVWFGIFWNGSHTTVPTQTQHDPPWSVFVTPTQHWTRHKLERAETFESECPVNTMQHLSKTKIEADMYNYWHKIETNRQEVRTDTPSPFSDFAQLRSKILQTEVKVRVYERRDAFSGGRWCTACKLFVLHFSTPLSFAHMQNLKTLRPTIIRLTTQNKLFKDILLTFSSPFRLSKGMHAMRCLECYMWVGTWEARLADVIDKGSHCLLMLAPT